MMSHTDKSKSTRACKALSIVNLCLLISILGFRVFVYPIMPVEANTAYGVADVLELFMAAVFVFSALLSVLFGLVIMIKVNGKSKKPATIMILFCLTLLLAYKPLHSVAASISFSIPVTNL